MGKKKDLGKKQLGCLNVGYGWQLVTQVNPEGTVYITEFPFVTCMNPHANLSEAKQNRAYQKTTTNHNRESSPFTYYILGNQTGSYRTDTFIALFFEHR